MNKYFIIFALLSLTTNIQLCANNLLILLEALAQQSPHEIYRLHHPEGIQAIIDNVGPDIKNDTVTPDRLAPFFQNPAICHLMAEVVKVMESQQDC